MPLYRIPQLKLPLDHTPTDIPKKIAAVLGVNTSEIISFRIDRKSFDARDKGAIKIIHAITAALKTTLREGSGDSRNWIVAPEEERYLFPTASVGIAHTGRPVVIGAGPAGLFCALLLAEHGYRPLVLERGEDAATRLRTIDRFWTTGELSADSNMQFGEGGAGTFSDGKLNTTVTDRNQRSKKVLQEFITAGAPTEIAYLNKPHIGTDNLVEVVQNLRKKIVQLGGEVRFQAKVTAMMIEQGRIRGVVVNGTEEIPASAVVLAIGHSARDTFEYLATSPVTLEQKAFAIGLRIEHSQEMIQRNQFGASWKHPALPVADYKLTYHASNGRGVYSFCMCPGGFVVNASSEPGHVVCNGMSNFARNAHNANSAIVVSVQPEDFGSTHVLAGMEFQRRWERAAYQAANRILGFAMPVQRLEDFYDGRVSAKFGSLKPCAKGAVTLTDLNICLPDYVLTPIKEGLRHFDRTIPGFAHPDTLLTGVETRTSSPIRIVRDEQLQSNISGLFPCGEGAGYAGGIMSAAMDGIRVAEAVASLL
jgi:uncharacterized protein